jgi:hypothetical protein
MVVKFVAGQTAKAVGTAYGGPAAGRAAQAGTKFVLNLIPDDSSIVEAINDAGEPVVDAVSDAVQAAADTVSEVASPVIEAGEVAIEYVLHLFW